MSLCLTALASATPLCLTWQLDEQSEQAGEVTSRPRQTVKVTLAEDFLQIEDRDGRLVHDFRTKVSHLVKGDDYLRRSLYADLGFRVAEAHNRWAYSRRGEGTPGWTGPRPEEVVGVEHLFGVDDEVTESGIAKTQGETWVYRLGRTVLAEIRPEGPPLTAAQSRQLVRFLRYASGGHPDILSDVQTLGLVPQRVFLAVQRGDGWTSFDWTLQSCEPCSGVLPDFSGLRPTELPPEPLGTLVALGLQLQPKAAEEAAQALLVRAEGALAEGRALESALRTLEVLLMQGRTPEFLARARPSWESDPQAKRLMDALVLGQTEPRQAIERLETLQAHTPDLDYVLDVFQAGWWAELGEDARARDLFVRALAVNPSLAGVWKDLGDLYYRHFEMATAWLCWDIGRRLAPEHEMLQTVDTLERMLRTHHPGFF